MVGGIERGGSTDHARENGNCESNAAAFRREYTRCGGMSAVEAFWMGKMPDAEC